MRKRFLLGIALAVVVLVGAVWVRLQAGTGVHKAGQRGVAGEPSGRARVDAQSPAPVPMWRRGGPPTVLHINGRDVVMHRGHREEVVAALVEKLSRETPEESVKKLDQVGEYFAPGARSWRIVGGGGDIVGWMERTQQGLVDTVLSNRRFLKVLAEVGAMPKSEAGRLVATQIAQTLGDFKAREAVRIDRSKRLFATKGPVSRGLGIHISNNADGSPTFEGERFKLLALCLAAGSLELPEAHDAVRDVAQFAVQQRRQMLNNGFLSEAYRYSLVHYDILYSPQILAAALVGTSPGGLHGTTAEPVPASEWSSIPLPMYNAKRTAFDDVLSPGSVAGGGGRAADFGQGEQTVYLHAPMTDEAFDALLAQAR